MHLIRVAEHLGASSRRPRHPFTALMAGVTHGRVPVYTALKMPSHHARNCNCGKSAVQLPLLTATLALQLEPGSSSSCLGKFRECC